MSAPTIRAPKPSDVDALASLMGALGYPTDVQQMQSRLVELARDADCASFVAEAGATVVGMIGVRVTRGFEYDGFLGEIVALVVDEQHRGKGIGAKLVTAGEHWLGDRGVRNVKINTSHHRTETHRFYGRLGYAATGLRFTRAIEGRQPPA